MTSGVNSGKAGSGTADFVVVANRLPIDMERQPDGTVVWKRSPGGLVTALGPLLRKQHGAWIGWPGVVDGTRNPSSTPICVCTRCGLAATTSPATTRDFPTARYGRYTTTSSSNRSTTATGGTVTSRSTNASPRRQRGVAAKNATVWVQDYQLQLVPKMLRALRPDVTIGFFMHPFPPVELFMQLPWRTEIIDGLLGADLVGFHLRGCPELPGAGPPTKGIGGVSSVGRCAVAFG